MQVRLFAPVMDYMWLPGNSVCLFLFFFFASSALPRQHVTYMEINDFLNVLDLLSHSKEVVWCSQMPATP